MSDLKKEDSALIQTERSRKLLSSLGLCAKAGKIIFGVPMICEALRSVKGKEIALIIEASDTSMGTHKKIADKSSFYQVRTVRIDCDGATLASALGKTSSLAAIAIKDREMCKIVEKYI